MKETLIFSDSHLNEKFEQEKFDFLKKIISHADAVIIDGDFWEGWRMSFSDFVHSRWNRLFPLLKERKAVYIYGNHDKEEFSDDQVFMFSDIQTTQYTTHINGQDLMIEHGHLLRPPTVDRFRITRDLPFTQFATRRWDDIEGYMVKRFGSKFLEHYYRSWNNRMKTASNSNAILVCGHSHLAEIDLQNNFINAGMVRHGLGQYVVINDGQFSLKQSRY